MKKIIAKNKLQNRRKIRNRAKIWGTAEMPRLSIFRSNRFIIAQLINDDAGKTLLAGSSKQFKAKGKTGQSKLLGEYIGEKAAALGIKKAVFNKGPYLYHGRVKAVADGAKAKGLAL